MADPRLAWLGQVQCLLVHLGTVSLHLRLAARGRPAFHRLWDAQVCFGQRVRSGTTTLEGALMTIVVTG
jgi:hypothetical protein